MKFRYQAGDETKTVQVEQEGSGYIITVGEHRYHVAVQRSTPELLAFSIDDHHYQAVVASDESHRYIAFDADVFTFTKVEAVQRKRTNRPEDGSLTATMPGQVVKVLVAEGDSVKRGQPLIVLEAMKMEMRIAAPADGRVVKLLVNAGQIVERGQRLLELSV